MSIVDFIKNARGQGLTDDQVIQEIIKKYPEKRSTFNEAFKRKVTSSQIIEEIIKQNVSLPIKDVSLPIKEEKLEQTKRIEEAKERIESLKKEEFLKPKETIEKEERKIAESEEGFKAGTKEEILDEFLKRRAVSEGIENPEIAKEREEKETEQLPEEIIKPLPKRKGAFKRFLIRFSIFCFILIVLGLIVFFWYWYFVRQVSQASCTSDVNCQKGYACSGGVCKEEPKECFFDEECLKDYFCDNGNCKKRNVAVDISEPLFPLENTTTLEISSLEEIKDLLSQKSQEWINADTFRRIVFVNKEKNKEVELKELFSAISAKVPESFFLQLENNFTLFVYSQIQGNRIGFVAKIKNQKNFSNLLKSMEPTFKNNFELFFDLVNSKETYAEDKVFKDSTSIKSYVGPNFRYKVLSGYDGGIYYLASDKNYFIFTTSWRSMEKVINKLGLGISQ